MTFIAFPNVKVTVSLMQQYHSSHPHMEKSDKTRKTQLRDKQLLYYKLLYTTLQHSFFQYMKCMHVASLSQKLSSHKRAKEEI